MLSTPCVKQCHHPVHCHAGTVCSLAEHKRLSDPEDTQKRRESLKGLTENTFSGHVFRACRDASSSLICPGPVN